MGLKYKIKKYIRNELKKVITEILNEKKHNIKDELQNLALRETCIWIQDNVPINLMFEDRFSLLNNALGKIEIKNGLILEFGVYRGETINYISKTLRDNGKLIYGFDSFEGLREPWIFNNSGGFADVKGELPRVENNIKLIKGYFEDTLPDFLSNYSNKISFLHIDSDLYSSAKTIFEKLDDLIVEGTVIVFDEFFNYPGWKQGEFKAWNEFLEKRSLNFEYIGFTYQRTKLHKSGNQLAIRVL